MRTDIEIIKEGRSSRQFISNRKIVKTDSKIRVFQIKKEESKVLNMKTKWT